MMGALERMLLGYDFIERDLERDLDQPEWDRIDALGVGVRIVAGVNVWCDGDDPSVGYAGGWIVEQVHGFVELVGVGDGATVVGPCELPGYLEEWVEARAIERAEARAEGDAERAAEYAWEDRAYG